MRTADLRGLMLVSYHFPPMGGSGVQRALKLARYLPSAGWRAEVVCAGHTHYPLIDATLLEDLPDECRVHSTPGAEPGGAAAWMGARLRGLGCPGEWATRAEQRAFWRLERLCRVLPEAEWLWVPAAVARARRIVDAGAAEAVVTSGPPHGTHLAGLWLKRRRGLPWIADLRDPIVDNWARGSGPAAAWRIWLEQLIARHADHLVVTCPEVMEAMRLRHGPRLDGRMTFIPNGYDPEDFAGRLARAERERIRLACVGSFYREQTIGPVLEAFRELRSESAAGDIELRLIGNLSGEQRRLLRPGDADFLIDVGYLPHRAAVAEMRQADAVLLMTPATPRGRYCVPAKTFEYLASGRHILAAVHEETWLAGLLRRAGRTTVVTHEAGRRAGGLGSLLAGAIRDMKPLWRAADARPCRDAANVEAFSRPRQARDYGRLIEQCVDGGPRLRLAAPDAEAAA
jgi:glycosyltransferase involved in cell wall biosynthesis